MELKEIKKYQWKIDFWTIFLSIVSLILVILAIVLPEQRILMLIFIVISMILAIIFFYFQKTNYNEKTINILNNNIMNINQNLTEKFNYWKELDSLRVDVKMLKKQKRANIELIDIIKILIAVIIIYVIVQALKSF